MIPLDITDKFKEEILSGNCKYLKDGVVTFNEITFGFINREFEIRFYYERDHVATVRSKDYIPEGTWTLRLFDGQMKVDLRL